MSNCIRRLRDAVKTLDAQGDPITSGAREQLKWTDRVEAISTS